MEITLDIPESVATSLSRGGVAVPRAVLEGFAVEGYRQGLLTAMQVRLLLDHGSRWETQDFLRSREALRGLTAEEILEDAALASAARAGA